MAKTSNNARLGRGLDAIFGNLSQLENHSLDSSLTQISVDKIVPNQNQPRKNIDEVNLANLVNSIQAKGILQPILLSRQDDKGHYQIIAGERRYQAAKRLGLHSVPAIVRDINELETIEIALIENIQREDLSVIEEAMAYKHILDMKQYSQEELAKRLGKSRSHIANILRILNLSQEVKDKINTKEISFAHARSLAVMNEEEQKEWLKTIVQDKMSVRDLEKKIRKTKEYQNLEPGTQLKKSSVHLSLKKNMAEEEKCKTFVREIEETLGLKLSIEGNLTQGKVIFPYGNEKDLQKIVNILTMI